jgi:predicted nucleic acid-binding Zn ribbon protein
MANCVKCGQPTNEGASFCSSCGTEVVATDQLDSDKTTIEIHKAKRRERIGWGIIVAGIILEGIGAWFLLRNYPDVGVGWALMAPGIVLGLMGCGITIYSLRRQSRLERKLKQQGETK